MNMKMLYIGCHAILEYNEVSLFNEIGIDIFSLGSYLDPSKPGDPKRPSIKKEPNHEMIRIAPSMDNLTTEFVNNFDIVYVMHIPEWLEKNWDIIKNKIVIWRSIGQSVESVENILRKFRNNLKIVRYSPMERNIPGYVGEDTIIRFHIDPNEFNNWNGSTNRILTIGQNMKNRGISCSYEIFEEVTRGLPRIIYGPENESSGDLNGGILSFEDLKIALRNHRVYFYTGTHPASYVLNFMEAWTTGIPIVAIGDKYGNGHYFNQFTYEIPSMVKNIYEDQRMNGFNMLVSNDISTLHNYCKMLLEDESLARDIGRLGRESAIQYFGKDNIKPQWEEFFYHLKS